MINKILIFIGTNYYKISNIKIQRIFKTLVLFSIASLCWKERVFDTSGYKN